MFRPKPWVRSKLSWGTLCGDCAPEVTISAPGTRGGGGGGTPVGSILSGRWIRGSSRRHLKPAFTPAPFPSGPNLTVTEMVLDRHKLVLFSRMPSFWEMTPSQEPYCLVCLSETMRQILARICLAHKFLCVTATQWGEDHTFSLPPVCRLGALGATK